MLNEKISVVESFNMPIADDKNTRKSLNALKMI